MKLFYASTLLISAAAKQSEDAAGLRGQQQQEKGDRELFLFDNWGSNSGSGGGMGDDSQASFFDGAADMLFGGMGSGSNSMMGMGDSQCGDTCENKEVCDSFLSLAAMFDPTSVFEEACNAGCFPSARLEHCGVVCGTGADTPEESEVSLQTEAAVSSAIARAGFIDVTAAKRTMCGDCKFYSCCVDSSEAADPTKYDTCKGYLDENLQHQAIGDSLLEEIFSSVSEAIDTVMENVAEVVEEFTQELNITDALQLAEQGEDGALPSILSQVVDSFANMFEAESEEMDWENMDLFQQWPDFSISDWGDGAVWSGTEDASGLALFGQVPGSFKCPDTCEDEELCKNVFVGLGDRATLENACNSGCLPAPENCEDICGNAADGPEFLATITDMACKSCTFFECCSAKAEEGADPKFDTCQVHLPDTVDILANIGFDGSQVQEWVDSFDLSSIAEDLDLSELQTLFDETMANFESFPVTCNPDSCPITGLCDMNIDMASVDFDEVCTENALFQCGDGLETMCSGECNNPHRDGFAPMCALCNVATCCSTAKEDGKLFQDCAMGALTYQLDAMEEEEFSGSEDVLVAEETPSESNESPAAIDSDDGDAVVEQSSPSTEGTPEDSTSETVETALGTEEEEELPELDGPIQVQASIAEVNRVDNIQSGSYTLQASMTFALASLTALVFVSV